MQKDLESELMLDGNNFRADDDPIDDVGMAPSTQRSEEQFITVATKGKKKGGVVEKKSVDGASHSHSLYNRNQKEEKDRRSR